ncbi:WD repeat-containing protein on Y chromosome-like [Colossoma macropomum]|uniref:WD repeat-containing protein on Y chromosome-like n=1 Tax=Colossoma macropomum TaxID=42526 RepID=UPI0018655DBE|nr:WD repeat-containing protein on Y chromosome-like [Colossoma macropomum]
MKYLFGDLALRPYVAIISCRGEVHLGVGLGGAQGKSAYGDKEIPAPSHLEDQINEQHLRLIERMFKEANKTGGKGLNMKDFREAMKKIMKDVEDEDIDIIFMKVDSNCDGILEWEDYLDYMFLEYKQKDILQQKNRLLYFPKPLKIVPADHHDIIVQLQFYSFQHPAGDKKMDPGEHGTAVGSVNGGRYLSISQNGTLSFWSESFKLQRTVNISKMAHTAGQPISVTNMLCLGNINQLCISFSGRDIEFYDVSVSKCELIYSLSGLEANVLVMDYWTDGKRGIYSFGDFNGTVFIFTSANVVQNGLFNSVAFKAAGNIPRIAVSNLLKNSCIPFLCFKVPLHSVWIRQIRYIPDLNSVATCCTADRTTMALTTVPHSSICKIDTARFHVQMGIMCFDYSPEFNILVTGGFDGVIRVWNPYVTSRATSQLKGCSAAITHLMVNGKQNIVISVSKDKSVCVWDLQHCKCVQNIHPRNIRLGRFPISCTYYNHNTNTVVLATYNIGVLQGLVDGKDNTMAETVTSHEQPVCAALYNANFRQVVSGCRAGEVNVWDILSGEKVMQFQANPKQPVEVTAMAFDGLKRRLITASTDGMLRLWNFNNGALLRQLPLVDNSENTMQVMDSGSRDTDTTQKVVLNVSHTKSSRRNIVSPPPSNYSQARRCRFQAPFQSGSGMDRIKEALQKPKEGSVVSAVNLNTSSIAVVKVLFLNTREMSPDTAILLSSATDGYVYAWSISQSGGLLGKFRPAQRDDLFISSMSTDSRDQMLLTGDSHGYIMLWDIEKYCYQMHRQSLCEDKSPGEESLRLWELIPYYCRVQGPRAVGVQQEKEVIDGWSVSLTPPELLSSWRCHLKGIAHLEYVERYHLIITASVDCNVRLWTIAGHHIGTFGQSCWQVGNLDARPYELPLDLRRAGSFQTLKVLNKGRRPHWRSVKYILPILASQRRHQSSMSKEDLSAADANISTYSLEQIDHTWTVRQERGKQLRVYNAMHCTDLLPIIQHPMPDILKNHQQRMPKTSKTGHKQKKIL